MTLRRVSVDQMNVVGVNDTVFELCLMYHKSIRMDNDVCDAISVQIVRLLIILWLNDLNPVFTNSHRIAQTQNRKTSRFLKANENGICSLRCFTQALKINAVHAK